MFIVVCVADKRRLLVASLQSYRRLDCVRRRKMYCRNCFSRRKGLTRAIDCTNVVSSHPRQTFQTPQNFHKKSECSGLRAVALVGGCVSVLFEKISSKDIGIVMEESYRMRSDSAGITKSSFQPKSVEK
ncbi:hypothetical protein BDZ89DRAFT_1065969 [Hymenopellis radicata]|nr:hypothetical protein BDZ89DRAFT_1065969 [Hymenopellis radicata]